MEQTPGYEGVSSTMPETAKQEDQEQIEIGSGRPFPVTTQWYIQIIPEPVRQCHMPPAPELRDTPGPVGLIKVLWKGEPHHFAQPDCHIGITREIEIDLKRVCHHTKPRQGRGQFVDRKRKDQVSHLPHCVGNENFLSQSYAEPEDPIGETRQGDGSVFNAFFDIGIPDNGPRNQLWKIGQVHTKAHYRIGWFHSLTININQVGSRLEGIKGNTNRQGYG